MARAIAMVAAIVFAVAILVAATGCALVLWITGLLSGAAPTC